LEHLLWRSSAPPCSLVWPSPSSPCGKALPPALGTAIRWASAPVIEHTSDPRGFAERLMRLLRPKGLLILCAPLHPSPLTEIPNFLNNVPPHHMTWWNTRAFSALAEQLALRPVEIAELPASPHNALVPWVHKFSFCRSGKAPDERYIAIAGPGISIWP
jgi:SAM-dependent methyltransferase